MIEITGVAVKGNREMEYTPGQFAFLKFTDKSMKFPSHPFTMSSAYKKGEIQFTIKNLGDHTARLVNKAKIGDMFSATRPHGIMNFLKGSKHQIWIAGGIGITPFRSFYQTNIPDEFSIDFFYAYNNQTEAPYVEEIRVINQSNLRTHLIDASTDGFLTAAIIKERANTINLVEIYFCGPKPMRDSLIKNLKTNGLNVSKFYYDYFEFK